MTDAVIDPLAVMVHLVDALVASAAVVETRWLDSVADLAFRNAWVGVDGQMGLPSVAEFQHEEDEEEGVCL